jgi:hypothetical protein
VDPTALDHLEQSATASQLSMGGDELEESGDLNTEQLLGRYQ